MEKKKRNSKSAKKLKKAADIIINPGAESVENSIERQAEEAIKSEVDAKTEEFLQSKELAANKESFWKYSTFVLAALVIVMGFMMLSQKTGAPTGLAIDNPEQQNTEQGPNADDDPFIGPENSQITVIEFSDFECPFCGAAAGTHEMLIARFKQQDPSWEASVPKLIELAKQNKIKFVYRDYPLPGHANAQKAAEAGECANEQGKFWEYHDKLFENQEALDIASLKKYAIQIKLDTKKFNDCLDSGKMAAEVQKDLADGNAAGVRGTPMFFVNGNKVEGAQPFKSFEQFLK